MLKVWLIYRKEDVEKNTFFINQLINAGEKLGIRVVLKIRETLGIGIWNNELSIMGVPKNQLPQCVINRSRDTYIAMQFEKMNIRVFNSCEVTATANDKIKTHQLVSSLGITTVNTLFWDSKVMSPEQMVLEYPVVVKTIDGHGGNQVFKVENKERFIAVVERLGTRELVVQEMCSQVGVDVRTFVLGNEVLGAIKRTSHTDFRANYSLGGETSLYKLSEVERKLIDKIVNRLKCDWVGIDFMINQEGKFIFNEVEDVVGCRTLYKHTDKDIAAMYIAYIKNEMCH